MSVEHGTTSRYEYGCRCEECCQAKRDYDLERPAIMCRSCGIRKRMRLPITADAPSAIRLEKMQYRLIRQFAAEFDLLSDGMTFTATEFMDWWEPSIVGTAAHQRGVELVRDGPYPLTSGRARATVAKGHRADDDMRCEADGETWPCKTLVEAWDAA
jgi:hypothetical protein